MGKKVFSFIPYYYSPHLETDLEIIHKHVAAGDEVTVFVCSGELPSCDANIIHDLVVCQHCVTKRRNGLNLAELNDKVKLQNFLNLKPTDLEIFKQFQGLKSKTLEELLALKLDNCDIGKTIYNEIVSLKHETIPDMEALSDYISRSIESCVLIYLSFKNHFNDQRPDIFYTFNGRFVVSHPAVAAARACGTAFAVHDRGGMLNRYELVHNASLHSVKYWNDYALSWWERSKHTFAEKEALASGWYAERIQGVKQGWFSFTADQNIELPASFDSNKTNITVFISSEWEFCGIDEYKLLFYESQNEGLLRLAEDLQNRSDIQIYLRVHPHLKDKDNAQTKFIAEKLTNRFSNVEVIAADSPIKSYTLMAKSDAVVTFGSTVGVEAAFLRVPSILIGRAWFEDLDACLIPSSHPELVEMLLNKSYKLSEAELDRRRTNSLKYAYLLQTCGIPYELFEQVDIFEITLKGQKVSNQAPNYEQGLKQELAQRGELKETNPPNSLTALVRELEATVDKYAQENADLKAKLAALENQRISQPAQLPETKSLTKSLSERFRRILR